MQVKITALTRRSAVILFNYNFFRHFAIHALIEKSSSEYSRYLHDRGFINEAKNKRFKLFTFLKLLFARAKIRKTPHPMRWFGCRGVGGQSSQHQARVFAQFRQGTKNSTRRVGCAHQMIESLFIFFDGYLNFPGSMVIE